MSNNMAVFCQILSQIAAVMFQVPFSFFVIQQYLNLPGVRGSCGIASQTWITDLDICHIEAIAL